MLCEQSCEGCDVLLHGPSNIGRRLGHIAVVLYGTRVVVAGTWSGRFLADFDPAYPIQANFSEISARCARRQIFNQILRNTDLGQYVRSALVCAEASS